MAYIFFFLPVKEILMYFCALSLNTVDGFVCLIDRKRPSLLCFWSEFAPPFRVYYCPVVPLSHSQRSAAFTDGFMRHTGSSGKCFVSYANPDVIFRVKPPVGAEQVPGGSYSH